MTEKKTSILVVAAEKGGVGKTTTSFALAAGFARRGQSVLLVALDRQRNLNDYVGHCLTGKPTISEMLYFVVAGMQYDPADCIVPLPDEGIDYIPSNDMFASVNSVLANDSSSQEVLARFFRHEYFRRYDVILLDCKPSLDLSVVNAFVASTGILIPVQAEKFAMDMVHQIHDSYVKVKQTLNPGLCIAGILLTMYNRTNMAAAVDESLRETYGDLVLRTRISRLVEATNSTAEQKSLVRMGGRLGEEYMAVVDELLQRGY